MTVHVFAVHLANYFWEYAAILTLPLPVLQRIFKSLIYIPDFDAGVQKFGGVHHAIGAGRLGGDAIEFLVALPKFKFLLWFQDALNRLDDFARGDETGVDDVVNSEGRAQFLSVEAGANKIGAMRNGIHVVINFRVTLDFA